MNERIAALANSLVENGVRALFGVPGSGLSLQLITALEEYGVPFYGATHEAAGAIMAGAFAKQTNSLGCAVSIKGPGFANMLPGIISNYYEQLPVLSISEAFGPATPPFRMHKRLDQQALAQSCTKAYATLGDPKNTIAQLASTARAEIPGPVHLDLFSEDSPVLEVQSSRFNVQSPTRSILDFGPETLNAARPVVIAGSLALRRGWGERLRELKVPVFTTVAAKGLVDERAPRAAGIFTGDGKAVTPEKIVLAEADLVIGLGLRNLEVLSPAPFAAPLVALDEAGPGVMEGFQPEVAIAGAQSANFEQVISMLDTIEWGAGLVADATRMLRDRLVRIAWLPGRVFAELQGLLPGARLVVDTGSFCTVAEHVWQATSPDGFVASANGRYMGTGLPMAIGAALADPDRPTICATGDGGIRMYFGEIKLAIEQKRPLLVVLMADGRYGSIASAPSARNLSKRATTILQPSWYRAVQALGCPATQVTNIEALASAVANWQPNEGPLFIEAVFDPERYGAMTQDVR